MKKWIFRIVLHGVLGIIGVMAGALVRWTFSSGLATAKTGRATPVLTDEASKTSSSFPAATAGEITLEPALKLLAMASNDPALLWKELFSMPLMTFDSYDTLRSLFTKLLKLEGAAVFEKLKDHPQGGSLKNFALDSWVKTDSSAALAWMRNHQPSKAKRLETWLAAGGEAKDWSCYTGFPSLPKAYWENLATKAPQAATAMVNTLHPRLQDQLVNALYATQKKTLSPSALLQWANGLPSGQASSEVQAKAFRELWKSDPAAAQASWMALPPGNKKKDALVEIAKNAAAQPQAFLSWAESLPSSTAKDEAIVTALGKADLATLTSWEDRIKSPESRKWLRDQMLSKMIKTDSQQTVLATIQTMEKDGVYKVREDFADQFKALSPEAYASTIKTMPDGLNAAALAGPWITGVVRGDTDSALAELDALPPGSVRDTLQKAIFSNKSTDPAVLNRKLQSGEPFEKVSAGLALATTPAQKVAFLATLPPEQRVEAESQVMKESTPQQAISYLQEYPNSPVNQPSAYQKIAGDWIGNQHEETSRWVDTLRPGANRDAAVHGLVAGMMTSDWDPAAALIWAGSVADSTQRSALQQRVIQTWSLRDPKAAQTAANTLNPNP